jgi:DNA-binding NarL/FixJ family response regulator
MAAHPIDCAVVSADRAFVAKAIRVIGAPERGLRLVRDFTQPLTDLSKSEADALRTSTAQIVLLDIGEDAAVGLRLARFLTEDNPGRTFVLTGPPVAPEVLLEAMRLGVSEYLPRPVEEADLAAALLATMGGGEVRTGRWGPIIAVYSAKRRAGATTAATNRAVGSPCMTLPCWSISISTFRRVCSDCGRYSLSMSSEPAAWIAICWPRSWNGTVEVNVRPRPRSSGPANP